jgi:hypothetical protein
MTTDSGVADGRGLVFIDLKDGSNMLSSSQVALGRQDGGQVAAIVLTAFIWLARVQCIQSYTREETVFLGRPMNRDTGV